MYTFFEKATESLKCCIELLQFFNRLHSGPLVIFIFTGFEKYLYWHINKSISLSNRLILTQDTPI